MISLLDRSLINRALSQHIRHLLPDLGFVSGAERNNVIHFIQTGVTWAMGIKPIGVISWSFQWLVEHGIPERLLLRGFRTDDGEITDVFY